MLFKAAVPFYTPNSNVKTLQGEAFELADKGLARDTWVSSKGDWVYVPLTSALSFAKVHPGRHQVWFKWLVSITPREVWIEF